MTGAERASAEQASADVASGGWWFPALPRQRVRMLRVVLYVFVVVDVTLTTRFVVAHRLTPSTLYEPLFLARLLPIPVPTGSSIAILGAGLVASAVAAAVSSVRGRGTTATGAMVFALYLVWMLVAMSYGKVDHDRFALLVALAVLPTAGAVLPADRGSDERSGWALRMVQVAVMATYFLAAVAKLRYGGLDWLDSATLQRAVTRRGTALGDVAAGVPGLLHLSQYLIVGFELAAPLMLRRDRLGQLLVAGAVTLHVVTAATTGITFLPHVVCLLAFVPLERTVGWYERRARPRAAAAPPASSRELPLPSR